MKIYTKTGDSGETSLFSGKRVSKSHSLIESFGMLDELNTEIGLLIYSLKSTEKRKIEGGGQIGFGDGFDFLEGLQSQIFSLGSYLASDCKDKKYILSAKAWVLDQEVYMDNLDKHLPSLANFILPGGAQSACEAHRCRVLTRKVERFVVGAEFGVDGADVILYLNRLSDFFFVFARWINFSLKVEEPIWRA